MDKVGDLLIRIKNSYLASKKEAMVSYSKLNMAICSVLQKHGFIESFKQENREIKVALKYDDKRPALTNIKRISKPGRRVYQGKKFLPYVYSGLGIAIISTPKGILTDREARKEGVGGEVMAYVW